MTKPERWQDATSATAVAQSCLVPTIFGAWVGAVAGGIGNKVLDVGGETAVLARKAPRRTDAPLRSR